MVEHAGMLNHLYAKIRDLQISAKDRLAQTASQNFDISVWQFMAALAVGGVVEIVPEEIAHDPAALWQTVQRGEITLLEMVPSLLAGVINEKDLHDKAVGLRRPIGTGEGVL